jgi:hypothetical protein
MSEPTYIVTGGNERGVRVWKLHNLNAAIKEARERADTLGQTVYVSKVIATVQVEHKVTEIEK